MRMFEFVNFDLSRDQILAELDRIREERRKVYGDNFIAMSHRSLLYAAEYKIERAIFTCDRTKKLDDVLDAINYLLFVAAKLKIKALSEARK